MTRALALVLLAACGGSDPTDAPATDGATTDGTGTGAWAAPEGGEIKVKTRDGVRLEADYYPVDVEGAPAVVLLHMIPPSNDRTNWPADFVASLTAEGWTVLNLDRRGAGGSKGTAIEAYEGENGKYDVEAAVLKLQEDGYGAIAILGASNGTTSMVDYTVWAGGEGLPEPVALGFMTGGSYTENQNPMESLPEVPAIFTYSTAEAAWSVAQQPLDPGTWSFLEYANGDHGTHMFTAEPSVGGDLVDFLRDVL